MELRAYGSSRTGTKSIPVASDHGYVAPGHWDQLIVWLLIPASRSSRHQEFSSAGSLVAIGRWKRQRWLLLICDTPLRWPKIMEIYLLIRRSVVIRENHRHPASVGQAKQPLIPACVSIAPAFTVAGKLGEPGQEFISERSSIVVFSVLPAKIMVLLTGRIIFRILHGKPGTCVVSGIITIMVSPRE
jgi:hypothetical protein